MFRKFLNWILGVLRQMVNQNEIKRALGVDVAVSQTMQEAIGLWSDLFMGKAPWLDSKTQSCGLPAAIASELARLTVVEMETSITGGARAAFLQEELQQVTDCLRASIETGCATGSVVFKPYVDDGHIAVDVVPAWRFFPTSYNSRGEVTGAVFPERVVNGNTYYTRMEHHQMTSAGYVVRNMAFRSDAETELGRPCSLQEVAEWDKLEEVVTFRYSDGTAPDGPLFAVFRVPWANNIDPESPLGASVYSRAVDLIREADRQYSRILWEYEGSELAVHASEMALRGKKMPERNRRLFVGLELDAGEKDLYSVFSPQIRDSSLFNGLNQLLRRIEFNCNLAYGTLSDPQNVDKTAEEIRSSRQRSYTAVCELQNAAQKALEQLVWAMDFYCSLYHLAPAGGYEASITWGDGILEDVDAEFTRRKLLADGGYLRREKLIAWYFHISEDEAAEYIPQSGGISFEDL